MLLSHVALHSLILFFRLYFELSKFLLQVSKLLAKCLSRFVATLHGIRQLCFEVSNLSLKVCDSLQMILYVSLFHLDLLPQASNLLLKVTDLIVFLSDCRFKCSNLS